MNAQPPGDERHVVLFDGLCGVCNRFNRFVIDRDRPGAFAFAALQSPTARALLARHGRTPDDLRTLYVVVRQAGRTTTLRAKAVRS